MLTDIILVLLILAGSVVLFVTERLPIDLVAMGVLAALLLTGLVPESHILDGFSSPATITVACMFVLSAGLQRTGVISLVAAQISRLAGKGSTRLVFVIMLSCGLMSAFINNTAAVAVLLPVALALCTKTHTSPTRVLMPLSFAAQFGGVCTLIGTSTNLLVNSEIKKHGMAGFGMFEFTTFGLLLFVVGMVYLLLASRYMLPDRGNPADKSAEYGLQDYLTEMRVIEGSRLVGQTAADCALKELGEDLRILEIIRSDRMIWAPQTTEIRPGDILLIRGDVNKLMEEASRLKLENWAERKLSDTHAKSTDITLVEVLVPVQSRLIGRTLSQLDFYWRYHAAVLGVRRRGVVLKQRLAKIPFEHGDTLLLQGHQSDLGHLGKEQDFILLQELSALKLRNSRAYLAIAILAGVVLSAAVGILPILSAALVGCGLMVLSRCLTMQEVYDALDMKVILLLAGLIPLGYALDNTGAAQTVVIWALDALGQNPRLALAATYLLTMLLTALMSNNATAVLLAPLCFSLGDKLGVSPAPFVLAVTFAASTCFTTPVGYQTNAMVYGPGDYRYLDFIKVGLPLNLLFFALSVWLIPLWWHF